MTFRHQAQYCISAEAEMLQHRGAVAIDKNIGVLDQLHELPPTLKCLEIDVHADLADTPVQQRDRELGVGRAANADNRCTEGGTDPTNRRCGNGSS